MFKLTSLFKRKTNETITESKRQSPDTLPVYNAPTHGCIEDIADDIQSKADRKIELERKRTKIEKAVHRNTRKRHSRK